MRGFSNAARIAVDSEGISTYPYGPSALKGGLRMNDKNVQDFTWLTTTQRVVTPYSKRQDIISKVPDVPKEPVWPKVIARVNAEKAQKLNQYCIQGKAQVRPLPAQLQKNKATKKSKETTFSTSSSESSSDSDFDSDSSFSLSSSDDECASKQTCTMTLGMSSSDSSSCSCSSCESSETESSCSCSISSSECCSTTLISGSPESVKDRRRKKHSTFSTFEQSQDSTKYTSCESTKITSIDSSKYSSSCCSSCPSNLSSDESDCTLTDDESD